MATVIDPEQLITGDGWVIARYSRVQCVYFSPVVDDASFDEYLEELEADINSRSANNRLGVLYYVPESKMSSARRKRMAKLLEDHKQQIAVSTAAYALVTDSAFVRGLLTTLFWLAPPGYPYKMLATPEQGMAFIAEHVPGLDARAMARAFMRLLSTGLEQVG